MAGREGSENLFPQQRDGELVDETAAVQSSSLGEYKNELKLTRIRFPWMATGLVVSSLVAGMLVWESNQHDATWVGTTWIAMSLDEPIEIAEGSKDDQLKQFKKEGSISAVRLLKNPSVLREISDKTDVRTAFRNFRTEAIRLSDSELSNMIFENLRENLSIQMIDEGPWEEIGYSGILGEEKTKTVLNETVKVVKSTAEKLVAERNSAGYKIAQELSKNYGRHLTVVSKTLFEFERSHSRLVSDEYPAYSERNRRRLESEMGLVQELFGQAERMKLIYEEGGLSVAVEQLGRKPIHVERQKGNKNIWQICLLVFSAPYVAGLLFWGPVSITQRKVLKRLSAEWSR